MSTLIALAAITAVGSAIRSTWSPCGLSMLSTITPLAERSRGRRWGLTATWFLLGAARLVARGEYVIPPSSAR